MAQYVYVYFPIILGQPSTAICILYITILINENQLTVITSLDNVSTITKHFLNCFYCISHIELLFTLLSVIIQSIFIAFQNIVLPSKSRIRPYFLFITLSANRYTRVPRVCGQRSAGFLSNAFARSIASST